jgi:hypothetical protein
MTRVLWSLMMAGGLALTACDSETGPNPPGLIVGYTLDGSGDGQLGPVSHTLPDELRMRISEDGRPLAGIPVSWSTTSGSVWPAEGTTDADGVAEAAWTLGPEPGPHSTSATAQGLESDPVVFTAYGMVP